MDNFIALLLVPFISSLIVLFTKPISQKNIQILLKFSGAFLFGIIIFHLMPEIFSHSQNGKILGAFIVLGILIQSSLEIFSKGVEHGHGIKKTSLSIFFSICIHAFIEGMPLHSGHNCIEHNSDNSSLLLGIIVHKIPVVIILSYLFLENYSKFKTILLLLIFSFMSPLGLLLGDISFLREYHVYITALASGVLIHVSTFMIYGEHEQHDIKLYKLFTIILGFLIAFIIV